jgi:hypothetical protein
MAVYSNTDCSQFFPGKLFLMRIFFPLLFLVLPATLFGQGKELKFTKIDNNACNRYFVACIDSFYLNLPVVRNSNFSTHIRISLPGQRIDFFSKDNLNFHGILTNEITRYKGVKTKWGKPHRIIFQKIQLDPLLSSEVAKAILNSGQTSNPTDSLITSWKKYLDCDWIKFQFKIKESYIQQHYRCPLSQPEQVKYRDVIIDNLVILNKDLELEKRYDEFLKLLPKKKTYSKDGYEMLFLLPLKE